MKGAADPSQHIFGSAMPQQPFYNDLPAPLPFSMNYPEWDDVSCLDSALSMPGAFSRESSKRASFRALHLWLSRLSVQFTASKLLLIFGSRASFPHADASALEVVPVADPSPADMPMDASTLSDGMEVDVALPEVQTQNPLASSVHALMAVSEVEFDASERVRICNEIATLSSEHKQHVLAIVFREERNCIMQSIDGHMSFDLHQLSNTTVSKLSEFISSTRFPVVHHVSLAASVAEDCKTENEPRSGAAKRKAEYGAQDFENSKRRLLSQDSYTNSWVATGSSEEASGNDPFEETSSSSDGDFSGENQGRRRRVNAAAANNGKFLLNIELYDMRDVKVEDGEFKCPKCPRTFCDSSNLNKHVRTHTEERPYACTECGKCFTHSSTLKDHMNIHSGARPYACSHPGCDKSFSNGSNLNRHMRTHTGEKPYKCLVCKKAFSQSSNLKVHMKTHQRV